ncbi:MAG: inositol monophosphatase [Prevotellaceae bacterium]|jgi:myo-inositol-1(or 4)-monophosphatase|nr:inositol monophosphatase [Prevotellaceae bacterium]
MNISLKEICVEVCAIARRAGKFIADERGNFSSDRVESKGANDFVSYVDRTAEEIIVKELNPLMDAGFITEEKTVKQSRTQPFKWIIDPLDGTTNYIHGLSPFAVSIALVDSARVPLLGVVYLISENECFYASKGDCAYLNGEVIKPSNVTEIKDSLFISGFPHKVGADIEKYLNAIRRLTVASHGVRRLGSAAADLAYIACGRADVFFQTNLSPWDVAAGALVAQCAGATVTDFAGGDSHIFGKSIAAASCASLNEQCRKLLEEFFPAECSPESPTPDFDF